MTNPSSKNQIFFHLGLAKAASTFLQRQFFPTLSGIHFVKKKYFGKHRNTDFVSQHPNILFSFEFHKYLPVKLIEISKLYPEAKVILVFREHSSWLESKYRYHVRKHGKESFTAFFDLEDNRGVIRQEEVMYQQIIETVYTHFRQKPLFLNYHDLRKNPDRFFQPLCQYLGVELPTLPQRQTVNRAFNDKQIRYLLALNRVYPYAPLKSSVKMFNKIHYKFREFLLHSWAFLARFLPAKSPELPIIPTGIQDQIREFYKDDWAYCLSQVSRTTQNGQSP